MSTRTYRFSMTRLLTLRGHRERDAATTLAVARSAEDAVRASRAAAEDRHERARAAVVPAIGETRSVAELVNAAFLAEQLRARSVVAGDQLAVAQRETARHATVLAERVRDRRILERLRDREFETWRVAEARRERDEMDSFAMTRDFMRQNTNVPD